jgi:hypothetical protein
MFSGDAAVLYGEEFAEALSGTPDSAFLADGSHVAVRRGRPITYDQPARASVRLLGQNRKLAPCR